MIRKFQQQDEDAVIHIWLETSSVAHHFIPRDFWKSKTEEMRKIYIPQSETFIYTCSKTGEITGFISLVEDYLAAIFVLPAYQGQGIGQLLMGHAKKIKTKLKLNVYTGNSQAVLFYKRQGFNITREQTDEATGCQEFVMEFSPEEN